MLNIHGPSINLVILPDERCFVYVKQVKFDILNFPLAESKTSRIIYIYQFNPVYDKMKLEYEKKNERKETREYQFDEY